MFRIAWESCLRFICAQVCRSNRDRPLGAAFLAERGLSRHSNGIGIQVRLPVMQRGCGNFHLENTFAYQRHAGAVRGIWMDGWDAPMGCSVGVPMPARAHRGEHREVLGVP